MTGLRMGKGADREELNLPKPTAGAWQHRGRGDSYRPTAQAEIIKIVHKLKTSHRHTEWSSGPGEPGLPCAPPTSLPTAPASSHLHKGPNLLDSRSCLSLHRFSTSLPTDGSGSQLTRALSGPASHQRISITAPLFPGRVLGRSCLGLS